MRINHIFHRSVSHWAILRRTSGLLWPKHNWTIKAKVATSLGLLATGKLLSVTVPILFKHIVDSVNASKLTLESPLLSFDSISAVFDSPALTAASALLVGYGVARFTAVATQELRNAVFATVAQSAITHSAKTIFLHLFKLDYSFHQQKQTGGLIRAIDRGTKAISQILSSVVFHLLPTAVEITLVSCILGYSFGLDFVAVCAITVGLYSVFTFYTTIWRTEFRRQMNSADNQAASTATESLSNYMTVKHFNNDLYELKQYEKSLLNYQSAAVKTSYSLSFLNAGQALILSTGLTWMMYMAALNVLNGSMSVGDLVMVNGLLFQISIPLNFLGMVYRETQQSLVDLNTMYNLLEEKTTLKTGYNKLNSYDIEFRNVSLVRDVGIIKNVSFRVPEGSSCAIVGPSGCGKSTLFKLLFRFYEPSSGQVYIGGQEITDVGIESLRDSISIVSQDTSLFNRTIAYNIHYGRPDATTEKVTKALELAELNEVVDKLALKLETNLGERGSLLSGGEKQRVVLARAFLKNSPIALFDEATSSLDPTTEHLIENNIQRYLSTSADESYKFEGKKTSIFIAHRLATISNCDQIIVMNNGEIVERGTHDELLRLNGLYRELWQTQQWQEIKE